MLRGITREAYFLNASAIGEGQAYVIGPYGDLNPGRVLERLYVSNSGAKDLYIARTLTDALSGSKRYPISASSGVIDGQGDIDQLVLVNLNGSGGSTSARGQGVLGPRRNSGTVAGDRGTGEFACRVANAANTTTLVEVIAPYDLTVTAIKTYSKTVATSALGTYVLTAKVGTTTAHPGHVEPMLRWYPAC